MLPDVREAAEKYYTDKLSYHNFQHVEDTLEAANEILERCEEHDVDIDEEVVRTALYFHDAYYQKDNQRFGINSKEDLSKEVARVELSRLGYDEKFIQDVTQCIEATKHDSEPDANEGIAVRAADLRGLMGNYDEFQQNTEKLFREQKELHGERPDYVRWVETTLNILNHYASQDFELTPEHDTQEGLSEFHMELGRNIGQFYQDYVNEDMDVQIQVSEQIT